MTSPFDIWAFGWPIVISVGAIAIYLIVVRPRLARVKHVLSEADLGIATGTWFGWVREKVANFKTIILAVTAGIPQVLQLIDPNTLFDLQQMPWGEMFEPKVANWISLVCTILIPVTHAIGLKRAAEATPLEDE